MHTSVKNLQYKSPPIISIIEWVSRPSIAKSKPHLSTLQLEASSFAMNANSLKLEIMEISLSKTVTTVQWVPHTNMFNIRLDNSTEE